MTLVTRNLLTALAITIALTGTLVYAVNYLNSVRVDELTAVQHQLSIDSLSLETQFSLLESAPCENVASSTILTSQLSDLGNRLTYTENQLGSDNAQVIQLKEQYSLLEIRDYLITKRLAAACGNKPVIVLYFYANKNSCSDCERAGYALSYLRDVYKNVRVYSFDYTLDLGAVKTLESIQKLKGTLPAFVINGKNSYGFTSVDDLIARFPKGSLATTTATSTGSH